MALGRLANALLSAEGDKAKIYHVYNSFYSCFNRHSVIYIVGLRADALVWQEVTESRISGLLVQQHQFYRMFLALFLANGFNLAYNDIWYSHRFMDCDFILVVVA